MKRILSFMFLLVASLVLVGCNGDRDDNVIIVGLEADYVPFNWYETEATDNNVPLVGGGFVDGYDVQIAKLIAEHLGKELRIKMVSWKALIAELEAGEIDLIIAGMSPTAERKEQIAFSNAYYSSDHILVVNKTGDYANITSLEELEGAKGVGQISTIYDELVEQVAAEYGALHNTPRDNTGLMVQDILHGDADFMIVETPVALLYAAKYSNLSLLFEGAGNIFNVSDEDRDVSIGLRKTDTDLLVLVNEALASISAEQRQQIMESASLRAELDE